MKKGLAAGVLAGIVALAGVAGAQKETRGVSKGEIVLGMHTDLSGPAATYGVSSSNAVQDALRRGEREGRHPRAQDPADRRGHPVPGAARRAGGHQADQPRPHLRHGGAARHPHEQRPLQGSVRRGRAQSLPPLRRALDVRALPRAEVLRGGLLRRPDPRRHQLLCRGRRGRRPSAPCTRTPTSARRWWTAS